MLSNQIQTADTDCGYGLPNRQWHRLFKVRGNQLPEAGLGRQNLQAVQALGADASRAGKLAPKIRSNEAESLEILEDTGPLGKDERRLLPVFSAKIWRLTCFRSIRNSS